MTITLQLTYRSLTHPLGIIEDVLVKVHKFIFNVDFIILDMQEDKEVLIILGRPFLAIGREMIDVKKGELRLRVQEEEMTFNVFNAIKHPHDTDSCFRVDMLEAIVSIQLVPLEPLETSLSNDDPSSCEDGTVQEYVKWMDYFDLNRRKYFESLGASPSRMIPSIEKLPIVEDKQLLNHLRYAYLREESTLPVIISSSISNMEEEKLLKILKEHKEAIGWSLADIKAIKPSMCMHRILLEEDNKPIVDAQRCLNPSMKEVVWKDVLKWLDAGVIYPISDSSWVSLVQVVPKKVGTTVVINEKNELLLTRTFMGWRICIDCRRLNKVTIKDHFPLPFIDHMLDRLMGNEYFYFFDGYSGYNHITIAPEDQEKTTFTCPYGTFTFRRTPFRLCNTPRTFQRCMMAIFLDMVENSIEVFMDDFSVIGSTFDNCLHNLMLVLKRCMETNLDLN